MQDGETKEAVGFIGLGHMGYGMARNLLEKGFPLTILGRRNRTPVEDLVGRGAIEATSPAELARRATVVVLCVTGSAEVEMLVRGPNGLASALASGSVVIDCSTSDPNSTVSLAGDLARRGVAYVDAPLSRTPKEALAGTLDTMVGADEDTFRRIRPVLAAFAGKIVHVGALGDGHRMKLLNNFLSLGYGALYAEALALARKVGIDPHRFDAVIRGGRMDCGFYQTFMKWTLERDPEAHRFSLSNAAKDLSYLEAMAGAAGLSNPVGNAVKNSYVGPVARGAGGDFVPTLVDHVARANGIDPDAA